jgi:hypothetical protein
MGTRPRIDGTSAALQLLDSFPDQLVKLLRLRGVSLHTAVRLRRSGDWRQDRDLGLGLLHKALRE